jgi:hypothetical protein
MSVLLLATLASCKADKDAAPVPSEIDTELEFFTGENQAATLRPCANSATGNLETTIRVRVHAPKSIDVKRIQRHTLALERHWSQWGVTFELAGPLEVIDEKVLFVAAGPDASSALASAQNAKQGTLSQEERDGVLAPYVTAPLRRLLANLSPASTHEVQLLFVDRIADPKSPISAGLQYAAGLTLSPFAPASKQAQALETLIGINPRQLAAPVVALSMYELARLAPQIRITVLAHELGHAFGLSHGGSRENLMEPTRHARCVPGLNLEQLRVLQTHLVQDAP